MIVAWYAPKPDAPPAAAGPRSGKSRTQARNEAILMDELSDSRLIAQIQSGNIQAFNTLYEKYRHRVYRTALAITRDETAAEDILQECFLRVHAHIDKLHGEYTLAPWLYRVTVNLSYQWLNKDHRQFQIVRRLQEPLAQPSAPRTVEQEELQEIVARVLDMLSFDHRVVVVLYYMNEFSVEEIAHILDCPVGTVKSRLHYARRRLKELLAGEGRAWEGTLAWEWIG
ncbi:MAG: RNA polymerase sigma factor [Anaerolineae bacterium]|nr:RNA polymerase sigma factor [Anaerolineae bacterium]